jgi:multidrug efflux pump subunit AcrA (membrane-fusion protein)
MASNRRWTALAVVLAAAAAWYWTAERGEETAASEPLIVTIGYGNIETAIPATGTLRPREIGAVGAEASGELTDPTMMTVESEIFEADIPALEEGIEVYFKTLRGRDRRWYGNLDRILPEPATRNGAMLYTVLFDVDNSNGELVPGTAVQVFFVTSSAENVLTVPVGALTFTGTSDGVRNATVELVLPGGRTETRALVVGATDRVNAEVVSGLEEGDRVVAGVVLEAREPRLSPIEQELFSPPAGAP